MAAGNLGDLLLVGVHTIRDGMDADIIMDITEFVENTTYLSQFELGIQNIQGILETDRIFGVPGFNSQSDPRDPNFSGENPMPGNFLRWDVYMEIGAPPINNLYDLLDVVEQMVEAHPTTPDGQRVYGFSFFPDWDGGSVRMISEILNLYGYHWQNLYGAQLFSNWDSSSYSLMTDPDGIYLRALRLFNEAYRRGLVDPDSPTQDWDTLAAKVRDGRVMHAVWPWAGPNIFGMSMESAETTLAPFAFVPIGDMQIVMDGFSPFGTNLCAAIGAGATEPQRIIDFLDWMASPEGVMVMMNQIEGLTWEMVNGRPETTQFGMDAIRDNLTVPAEFGGGGFADGISNFNFHFVVGNDINPMFNEPFAASRWQSTLASDRNHFVLEWQEHFGVLSPMEYIVQNNMISVTPGMAFAAEPEDSSLQVMRSQVSTQFVNTSWQMLFARDEAEFDRLWDNMLELLPGFGFYEVMEWDLQVLEGMADAVSYTLERFR